MGIKKLVLIFAVAALAGCGEPKGSGFEGKWSQNTKENPSSLLIKRDGDIYHIDYTSNNHWLNEYENKKLEASAVSDSVLEIADSMGLANLRLEDGHIFFDDGEYSKSK